MLEVAKKAISLYVLGTGQTGQTGGSRRRRVEEVLPCDQITLGNKQEQARTSKKGREDKSILKSI